MRAPTTISVLLTLAIIGFTARAVPAQAYQVRAGDQFVQASLGGSYNYLRSRQVTRETPASLLRFGAHYAYAFDSHLSLTAGLMPGLADSYLSLPISAGLAYRLPGFKGPIVPYLSSDFIVEAGIPLGPPPVHLNLGLRLGAGLEYFVTHRVGFGAEFALSGTALLWPNIQAESAAELLFRCVYRI